MAHPSREKFIPYLRGKLGDVPVSMDSEGKGIIWDCKNSWSMFNPACEFHTVIQDDAIVCENFKERAETILTNESKIHKNIAFNWYYGRRVALREEAEIGLKKRYIFSNRPRWGVAICIPTRLIPEMLEFFDKLNNKQDDERISRFLNHKKMNVYFPMPSLIDHRTEEESLVGNALSGGRKAYKFIDD